jgi:hypothetical protein
VAETAPAGRFAGPVPPLIARPQLLQRLAAWLLQDTLDSIEAAFGVR